LLSLKLEHKTQPNSQDVQENVANVLTARDLDTNLFEYSD
jgi:hypothetical protein